MNPDDNEDSMNKNNSKSLNPSDEDDNDDDQKIQNDRIFNWGEEIYYAITFPGRIIMTLYSFHGLFFILNFLIQFIILVPGLLYDINSTSLQIVLSIVYIFFALFSSNLLIIPTYELLLFPYLRYRNVLAHLESLAIVKNIIDKDDEAKQELVLNKSRNFVDILLVIIELLYLIGFFLGFISITRIFTDVVHIIILFIIYFNYLVLYFGYIVISFHFMIKLVKHINNGCRCFGDFFVIYQSILIVFLKIKNLYQK